MTEKKTVFTSELITRINVVHQQELHHVNSTRTKLINRLETEISTKRKAQNNAVQEVRIKQGEIRRALNAHAAAVADNVDRQEILKLHSYHRSLRDTYLTEQHVVQIAKLVHKSFGFVASIFHFGVLPLTHE